MSYRRKRIGDILIAKKLVTQEQINEILPRTDGNRTRLGEVLISKGLVSEEDLARSLAEQRDLRYVDLANFRVPAKFFETIPLELMERYRFVPMEDSGELLAIAMTDPNNVPAIDELEMILDRQVEICVSTPSAIEAVLDRSGGFTVKTEKNTLTDFPPIKEEEVEEVLSFAAFDSAKDKSVPARPLRSTKDLIIVGDRVLIDPEEGMDKTPSGLYLPPTVKEKEKILGGSVVKVGPGYPIPDTTPEESWSSGKKDIKYLPLQAKEGDYAVFLRESAIEIEFSEKKYLIVPHSAILALVRTGLSEEH